jgi:hypothetical protein
MSLFSDYKIIKQLNNDYLFEYPYLYEFYNFKGISKDSLIELSKLIINDNNTIINFSDFTKIREKDILKGHLLLANIIHERYKYNSFMMNCINYAKDNMLDFIKFFCKIVMNRVFKTYNNVTNLNITYDLNGGYKIMNEYYSDICCFYDYYRNIEQKVNKHSDLILENNLYTKGHKYSYERFIKFILNIDIIKDITLNCSTKKLNDKQNDLVNHNLKKELLVDVIIKKLNRDNLEIDNYLSNKQLFVEHYEILNGYLPVLKNLAKYSSTEFNYLHFGQNNIQFLQSISYFIKSKYNQQYDSIINLYASFSKRDEINKINQVLNNKIKLINGTDISNETSTKAIQFISSDDVIDIEIDGYNITTINHIFNEDTNTSNFHIMDDMEREIMDSKIKEFEYSEYRKLCIVLSTLSVWGDCCIKHVALPLNSYLYYKGYQDISGFFINYLYIYHHLFEKVTLYKPSTSPTESLEFYVIGTNFRGIENQLKDKLLIDLDNFKLHQTFFKKEEIDDFFIKEVELFLELMTNRYIDYEKIKSLLKGVLLYNDLSYNFSFKKSEIAINFLNNTKLNKELNTDVYANWGNKNFSKSLINLKKLYYFTPVETISDNRLILDFSILEKLLNKQDFSKLNSKYDAKDTLNTVWFIHAYLPRRNFTIPENTALINMINDSILTSSVTLYQTCLNYNKSLTNKYLNEVHIINNDDYIEKYQSLFKTNELFYVKSSNKLDSKKNFIISSIDELHQLFNKIYNKKNLKKSMKSSSSSSSSNNIIVEKTSLNFLLYDNRKFHIRMFYVVFINSKNYIYSFMSKYGFIITAKDEYSLDPKFYKDIKVHVPHILFTKDDYLFPSDFDKEYGKNKSNIVSEKMINILSFIAKNQNNNISNYPTAKNGYSLMTADFSVDINFDVKLLELNSLSGLYTKHKASNEFMSNYLYGNIYNEIISPIFNLGKTKVTENFIPILARV